MVVWIAHASRVLDGRHLGLNTHVMLDGCRGIELEPGDIGRALDE